MGRKSWLLGILCMLLSLAVVPGQRAFMKEADFGLSVSETGGRIEVNVTLHEAKDLYAFDLVLKFDPVRLAYEGAELPLPGYTVKPVLSHGEVRLAHTSVGETPGRNGEIDLAAVTFKRIRGGNANVTLESARLVDSKLGMTESAPNTSVLLLTDAVAKLPADVAGHWSEEAVREAMELGFAAGFGDGMFRPGSPVTRLEATVLLAKALLLSGKGSPELSFADVGGIPSWGLPYVGKAVQVGWLNGYGDGTFRGGEAISRQEFAAIVARTLGTRPAAETDALSRFGDFHLLAPWAVDSAALLVEHGIMRGQGGGLLNPLSTTTRAEAVAMILRRLYMEP